MKRKDPSGDIFPRPDGVKLHYLSMAPAKARGTIILIHGLGEHSARYLDFAQFLNRHGWRVILYDQRGHGRSGGPRMYARSMEQLAEDLHDFVLFVHQTTPKSPLFLIAHSFGGQVAINFLAQNGLKIDGAVFSAPNVRVAIHVPVLKRAVSKLLTAILPTMTDNNEINPKYVSRDPAVVKKYNSDPLIQHRISVQLGIQLLDNVERIFDKIPRVNTPCLILHGSEDKITSVEGSREMYERIGSRDRKLKVYPGFYHEVLNEIGKEEVYTDIEKWLDKRASHASR